MKLVCFVTVAAIATSTPTLAQSQKTTVPAFFLISQHTDPSKATDWVRIQNAGNAVKIVVALGGQGGLQTLMGADLTNAQNQFNANRAAPANQLVLGYVDSGTDPNTGNLTLTTDQVLTTNGVNPTGILSVQPWMTKYQIDGIFLDRGPYFVPGSVETDADFQTFYTTLYKRIHPAKVMLNASQFPNDWIVSGNDPQNTPGADYAIVWRERSDKGRSVPSLPCSACPEA